MLSNPFYETHSGRETEGGLAGVKQGRGGRQTEVSYAFRTTERTGRKKKTPQDASTSTVGMSGGAKGMLTGK